MLATQICMLYRCRSYAIVGELASSPMEGTLSEQRLQSLSYVTFIHLGFSIIKTSSVAFSKTYFYTNPFFFFYYYYLVL